MTARARWRPLPEYGDLTWDQGLGRACVYCNEQIEHGGKEVGTLTEQRGAHRLRATVYAGPCCLGEGAK